MWLLRALEVQILCVWSPSSLFGVWFLHEPDLTAFGGPNEPGSSASLCSGSFILLGLSSPVWIPLMQPGSHSPSGLKLDVISTARFSSLSPKFGSLLILYFLLDPTTLITVLMALLCKGWLACFLRPLYRKLLEDYNHGYLICSSIYLSLLPHQSRFSSYSDRGIQCHKMMSTPWELTILPWFSFCWLGWRCT